ncbi:U11/U12 small nuclear ribonucleoprotein 48 kDa protein-like isoform X1 [Euwallacea similis]|uniref:U11/U12 small nuclear ribonucleoprotein 48 kDa protein-like isoform X1 n=1 Tax=Euwallacea similis TaxID=1736056 RepID=UPI00344C9EEB
MEFNLDIRKKQLESLGQYIKSSEDNVKSVFQSLGWNINKTVQDEDPKVMCPLNKHHLISKKTMSTHIKNCTLKTSGYSGDEQFLSEAPINSESSIKFSKTKKVELFIAVRGSKPEFKSSWNGRDPDPLTSDRLTSTFSGDERLALYDYSIKHTKGPPKPEEFTLELSDAREKKELSEKDQLIQARDSKRRRAKYKSVHTSKKSQTEIMKEVIDNQMALYIDWVKQKQEKELRDKERLKRLATEKRRKHETMEHYGSSYQYNEPAYAQGYESQNQPYMSEYNLNCSGQNFHANQGVITDWSHVYQGGIQTDVYLNTDQSTENNYSISNPCLTDSQYVGYEDNASNQNTYSDYQSQINYLQIKK